MSQLTGQDFQSISKALQQLSIEQLEKLALEGLKTRLDIVVNTSKSGFSIVFDLIQHCERTGSLGDLLDAAVHLFTDTPDIAIVHGQLRSHGLI